MSKYTKFLNLMDEKEYHKAGILIKDLFEEAVYPHYAIYDGYLDWIKENNIVTLEEKKNELKLFERKYLQISISFKVFNISKNNIELLGQKFNEIQEEIKSNLCKQNDEQIKAIKSGNSAILKQLEGKLLEIDKVEDKDSFDKLLIEVKTIESKLNPTKFDESEELFYNKLIDLYASKITSFTNYFSNIDLREYNLKALDDFKLTLDTFKKNKRKLLKNNNEFKKLLEEHFFIYDINKLYKETQEFYSYTYNYIFMRIDADYKYLFTDIALKTKKI